MSLEDKQQVIQNYFKVGNYNEALNRSKQLLRKNPNNPNIYNMIGLAYLQLGYIEDSIHNFQNSLKLFPENLPAINNIANAYRKIADYKKAEEFYELGLKKNPDYINLLVNFANFKMDINQVDGAINIYNKVLAADPKNYLIYFNLATAYRAQGNFENVKINALKALELKPDFTLADRLISSVTTYTKENNHFLKLKKIFMDKKISPKNKIYINFSLAKAFYDNNQFSEFLNQIEIGNKQKRDSISYDIEKDLKLFNNIKLLFKNYDFKKNGFKQNPKKLIFVLGMPRSGTSLLEQIISSHSNVFGAGELPFLQKSFLNKIRSLDSYNIEDAFPDLEKISQNYEDQLSILSTSDQIILDKSPLNFFLIGFIKILFPQSKIIHSKRDPKDTCFSCYKNLFDHGLSFTYDKKELAFFYNSYDDLMNFWNEQLGDFILTVNYETLINDPKNQIKDLLNFCDLDFEEKCINFQDNKSPIRTLSANQARKGIYKDSISSYELFKESLADIFINLKT